MDVQYTKKPAYLHFLVILGDGQLVARSVECVTSDWNHLPKGVDGLAGVSHVLLNKGSWTLVSLHEPAFLNRWVRYSSPGLD